MYIIYRESPGSPQGTVLLRKQYYSGTDLVLNLRFMTILIFETKKVIIWFHCETFQYETPCISLLENIQKPFLL